MLFPVAVFSSARCIHYDCRRINAEHVSLPATREMAQKGAPLQQRMWKTFTRAVVCMGQASAQSTREAIDHESNR